MAVTDVYRLYNLCTYVKYFIRTMFIICGSIFEKEVWACLLGGFLLLIHSSPSSRGKVAGGSGPREGRETGLRHSGRPRSGSGSVVVQDSPPLHLPTHSLGFVPVLCPPLHPPTHSLGFASSSACVGPVPWNSIPAAIPAATSIYLLASQEFYSKCLLPPVTCKPQLSRMPFLPKVAT